MVNHVSIEVKQGEIVGLLGPNGAGKTTAVECMAGLRRPDSGSIRVLGLDPQADGHALRERVGVQLQETHLQDKIKVWEALDLYASFYRRPADWNTLEARREVGAALASVQGPIGTVLLDDLGLLVTNHLLDLCGGADPSPETARVLDAALAAEIDALEAARAAGGWDLIVVTNEVGLGIVPGTALGRVFRDALGRANQTLAASTIKLMITASHQASRRPRRSP